MQKLSAMVWIKLQNLKKNILNLIIVWTYNNINIFHCKAVYSVFTLNASCTSWDTCHSQCFLYFMRYKKKDIDFSTKYFLDFARTQPKIWSSFIIWFKKKCFKAFLTCKCFKNSNIWHQFSGVYVTVSFEITIFLNVLY